ncbi:IgGFc-binding protein-like [Saccostrea echinata]|uniref:IgGFc-binding protein-like n=1 Tax=Saccostrea echinata TaxID=191078 RepID=UPI002A832DF4|nr:IgGFc-binding protein-like [Saccostrea echinata]
MMITPSDSRDSNLLAISTYRAGNVTLKKISVHYSMIPAYSVIESKAIRITTSALSSVVMVDDGEYTSDSTIVFPIDKLSRYYIISTAQPTRGFLDSGSHFTIAATKDNTHVSIVFAIDHNTTISLHDKEYGRGDTFSVILNNFQTFQIGHKADLSGTTINSSQPVAVFAGNRCNNIGYHGACSMLMEMIPPVNEFDNIFIVPPNINRYQSIVRIISAFHTKVTYTLDGIETTTTLLKNRYTDFITPENEISLIQSAKPVLVNVFATGSTNPKMYGDPYMNTVPGINQYLNQYIVDVPEGYNFSFAAFIVRNESLSNLQINSTNIYEYTKVFHSTIFVGTFLFSVMTVNVPSGVIQVETTDGSFFGMLIYGQRRHDGHGYAANALLTSIC